MPLCTKRMLSQKALPNRLVVTPPRLGVKAPQQPAHGTGCSCFTCHRHPQVATKAVAEAAANVVSKVTRKSQAEHLAERLGHVTKHFPSALSADDFLMRVEVALCAHGMRGDNCITCANLCRDESTGIFKQKVDNIFGATFNINGLGACLTCGNLGFKAGFSHSPNQDGRERYLFLSMPHIAIDSTGKLGAISRPGRPGPSSACGALIAALGQFQADAAMMDAYAEGEHDPLDPEFSILKQRLAARIRLEGIDIKELDIVGMTALAERTITADLEKMIEATVDTEAADYAVVTGVHIHSWGNEGTDHPSLEWIAPVAAYVVNSGKKTSIKLEVCLTGAALLEQLAGR